MKWEMFWITAAIVVVILIILSQIGSVRSWAGRIFGRVMPDVSPLGRLGGVLATISGKGWVRLLAIPLVVAGIVGVVTYVEGRGADRERIKEARRDTEIAEHERDLATKAIGLAEQTQVRTRRREEVIAQAHQEIDNAASQADFDALHRSYARDYLCVLDDRACENSPNPTPPGSDAVRGPDADRA